MYFIHAHWEWVECTFRHFYYSLSCLGWICFKDGLHECFGIYDMGTAMILMREGSEISNDIDWFWSYNQKSENYQHEF